MATVTLKTRRLKRAWTGGCLTTVYRFRVCEVNEDDTDIGSRIDEDWKRNRTNFGYVPSVTLTYIVIVYLFFSHAWSETRIGDSCLSNSRFMCWKRAFTPIFQRILFFTY
jgi:hypothetical protein